MLKSLTFALCFTSLAACANDAKWERSRAEYCQELELLANKTSADLEGIVAALKLQTVEQQPDGRQCGIINRDVRVIGARLEGFYTASKVLSVARPEKQSPEEAGFGARFPLTPIQSYDSEACLTGHAEDAAAKVSEINRTLAADFQKGLESCRSVGWKSSLAK